MDEYRVGGVADLISQGFTTDKKSIKKKEQKQVPETVESIEVKSKIKKKKLKINSDEVEEKSKKGKNSEFPELETKKKKEKKKTADEIASDLLSESEKLEDVPINKDAENPEETPKSLSRKERRKEKKKEKVPVKFEPKDFVENTVFVGNLPINYDKPKVYKVFSKFGKVRSIRIRCVPIADINMSKKVAAVKKKFNSNRNSLVAYVKYQNKDAAEAAAAANGMVIDGHHLRIDSAEENKERDNNKAVFVGGLPFDTEDDDLWELFQNCGTIKSVRVIRDSHTSMGKGFGYVNFDSTASVELALRLDGQQLKKRTINVKRCLNVRNKNKDNAFGKKRSREMTSELLARKGKKAEKKKLRMDKQKKPFKIGDFQGRKANVKQKKKKKPSKAALQKKKILMILESAYDFSGTTSSFSGSLDYKKEQ